MSRAFAEKQVAARPQAVPQPGYERVSGFYGRYNLPGGGSENKFFDTTLGWNFDATGEVPATGQLCLIPQGVTESTRVGRKCVVKSIQLRAYMIYTPGASTAGASNAYFYVVLDKQCNGAAAAIGDVLTGTNMGSALINLANSERFVILKRFVNRFQAAAGIQTAFGSDTSTIDWYHKCNIPLEYSSTTGAITEIKSNNIFILAGTDTTSDDVIAIGGTCRLRFSDD